jgi:hypothetical protein
MTRFSFGVDARTLAALAVLHVAMIAIVDPRGEFPVNDDWAYFRAVEWWFAEGRIRLPEWVGMNLATQTLAGAAVAGVFALKFETLRHLTQAVALAAIFGAYALFRALALERRDAFVATAAVIAFPPWAVLANSYMTDLYGLVFALPAAVLYVRALESPSRRMVVVATLLAIAGTLQRQVVLVIPFAYMAASLWSRPARSPRTIATAIAPFALTLGCEFAYHAYLALGPGIPIGQTVAHGRLLPMALKALANDENTAVLVLWNAAGIVGYLGLFAAGWIVWCIAGAPTRTRGLVIAGGVAVAALAFAAEWFPPYRADSVLDRAGIGPILFYEP